MENQAMENPTWLRVVMPSIADLIFVALLGTLVFTPLSVRLLGDAGIGWHIRTGQEIVRSGAVPRVDLFSASGVTGPEVGGTGHDAERSPKKWYAWEWLYDVVVGELEAKCGLNGVVWLTAVVIAAVFAWTFLLLMRRGTHVLVALVLVLLAISAAMIHFLARPHVVSWLLTLGWFLILSSAERGGDRGADGESAAMRRLWLLPLLMLVWVNVHGGFVLGFVLIKLFWLGAVWDWWRARGDRIEDHLEKIGAGQRVWRLIWVGLACGVASLINPYGWKLHEHIYLYLSNRFLMDHIEEFQSPNFHGVAQKCFLVLLLVSIAAVAARGRRLRASHVLTLLFAVYLGLYASRNIPIAAILLVMIVGPLLSQRDGMSGVFALRLSGPKLFESRLFEPGFFQRMAAVESRMRGHVWPLIAIVVTFAIAANGGYIGSNQLMDAHFNPARMPVAAVDHLEKLIVGRELRGSVLAPDYWGGYLIYRLYPSLYPQVRVVVDDRHDFYGEEFLKSYLKIMHVENGWQEFLEKHDAACVLLPRDSALANRLAVTPGWKSIYSDEVVIAFVRAGAR